MNWPEYFFSIAKTVSEKSKDKSTRVGCVIAGPDNGIRSTGYNGFPRGVNDDIPARHERPAKYKWTEHSERNAIYNASKIGIPLDGCILYIDWLPCSECSRGIIGAGIKKVVVDGDSESYNNTELNERWKEDHDIAKVMLSEAMVELVIYKRDLN